MAHNIHHEHLIKEITNMFGEIFKKSPQAIYIYLDDEHKICNQKFAKMLGYKSVQEWVDNPYTVDDIDEKDQPKGIKAFMSASEKLQAGVLTGTLVKQGGRKFKAEIIMAPFVYKKEVFVIHFISPKK